MIRLAAGVIAAYLLLMGGIYLNQRTLLFSASTERIQPDELDLEGTVEITLRNSTDHRLYSWYSKAGSGRPTVLYLHGNGGSIGTRAQILQQFRARGYGIFMTGYPGYGGSEGAPSEAALVDAAELAYRYLTTSGLTSAELVIFGESLGSAVAIRLAGQNSAAAVVLAAPMHSIREIAQSQYPFLPIRWLLKDPFLSFKHIPHVHQPLLVVHGSSDEAIPEESARRLFALASEPKQFELLEGAGHNNLFDFGLLDSLDTFLDAALPEPDTVLSEDAPAAWASP